MASSTSFNPLAPAPDLHSTPGSQSSHRTVIGQPPHNHWLHSASPPSFDLTRPPPPDFPVPSPHASLTLTTTTIPAILSPPLTALVIIDMQNFFLSSSLGRLASSAGNIAAHNLLTTAIPAARKAGIRIIWLNWGLTDHDLAHMPPSTLRTFGFEQTLYHKAQVQQEEKHPMPALDAHGINLTAVEEVSGLAQRDISAPSDEIATNETFENRKPPRIFHGLGSAIGPVQLPDGTTIDAGRLLMRDTWNASLPPSLQAAYEEGAQRPQNPDVWVHKNRMSGLWGASTPCTEFLEKEGIRTLLFAGVNTDQCVGGSLQDAFTRGWDCVLLADACGTTSPDFAKECVEFNCARTWGFVAGCKDLERGVERMVKAKIQ